MTRYKVPNRDPAAIVSLYNELKSVPSLAMSRTLVERVNTSGDSTGTPFYHFRWKLHFLADLVVYPTSQEHIRQVLLLANKYKVCVTPRGSGSCYYGSGLPTNGGIVVDMKRMHEFSVDPGAMTVSTQPGIVFQHLMTELAQKGYELGCFPTSAYTSTIGGWIGTGGIAGVGTLKNGSFEDQVVSIKVVTPIGKVTRYTDPSQFGHLFGTNGIFGIVVEVTMKIYPLAETEVALCFGFADRGDMLQCVDALAKSGNLFFVRFSDLRHEFRCTGQSQYNYYIFMILKGLAGFVYESRNSCTAIAEQFHGTFLGEEYSSILKEDYLKHEMTIKRGTPTLMLQQIYADLAHAPAIIDRFETLTRKARVNHAYYGIINKNNMVRLVLFTPTDNASWLHFLSSKAALHKVVKYAYRHGGRVYTYGLQNTLYFNHFEHEWNVFIKTIKMKEDPAYILNPLKVVATKMSYLRIDLMFELAYFYRLLAIRFGTAAIILSPELPEQKGGRSLA
jgi:FAD/FMN-containing dehydrogenase